MWLTPARELVKVWNPEDYEHFEAEYEGNYLSAAFEGRYLSVVLEGLPASYRWDDVSVALDEDCLGDPHQAFAAAKSLAKHLRQTRRGPETDDEIVELTRGTGHPWANFVDPRLSVVIPQDLTSAIMLYECSDHVALVVGWGSSWGAVASGPRALALIQTLEMKSRDMSRALAVDPEPTTIKPEPSEGHVASSASARDELGDLAEVWSEAGYRPEEALPWARAGLLPLHANRWAGWDVDVAIVCALRALRPEQVELWESQHPGQTAASWLRAGVALDAADEWLKRSVDLDQAMRHIAAGITEPRYLSQ